MTKSSSSPLAVDATATTAAVLVRALGNAGFALTASAGTLTVRPASRLTEDQRQAIRTHRNGLIELIERHDQEAIQWRVEAMRQQVVLGQALPLLVARRDVEATPDTCASCGDSLTGPVPVAGVGRCAVCRRAAWIITNDLGHERDAAIRPSGSIVTTEPHCSA